MKTREFIKKVEALGYEVVDNYGSDIHIFDDGFIVATIDKNLKNRLDTSSVSGIPDVLFSLLVEYAKTEVEYRGEPKLYLAKHKFLKSEENNHLIYLNYRVPFGSYSLHNSIDTHDCRTYFTEKELQDLGIWDSPEWERVEVAE